MFKQNFVGREEELQGLREQYNEDRSFVIIYGRRRVGKTELVRKFSQGKDHIYFLAGEKPEKESIAELQKIMANFLKDDFFPRIGFTGWEELFEEFMNRADKKLAGKKLIINIDEFPYLINENKAIPSIFQKIWDEILRGRNVMLILLGSSIGMMETHVLGYKSPLYGRRTGQWKLKPFGFKTFQEIFPRCSFEERLKFFSFTDGIPAYINKIDASKSPLWNMKNRIFKRGEYLYEEAENLLRQELRAPGNYFLILQAIAEGNRRYGKICNRTGLSKSLVSQYLNNLIELHVVKKEFPITQRKESRNALYRLNDHYYEFWFRFVYPNKNLIEENKQDILIRNISDELIIHESFVFEDVCGQILWDIYPMEFNRLGRWWHKGEEIDLVALNEKENRILFGECKWSRNKVGVDALKDLEKKAKEVEWRNKKREESFVLFSKSGFREELRREDSERQDLFLFGPENTVILR